MSSNNEKAEIKETQWAIDWKNPTLMVLWMVLSTGCAVGNHVFYQHLDGKPAENQDVSARGLIYLPFPHAQQNLVKFGRERTIHRHAD